MAHVGTGRTTAAAAAAVAIVAAVAAAAVLFNREDIGDGAGTDGTASLERHTLVYGGDLIAARRLNLSLWHEDEEEWRALFGDVVPVFREADIAMINLEGMISAGGYFNKLRSCTWMFRAHPRLADALKWMGMDLLILGNNHMGDYGRAALVETVDHIMHAGMEYVGAGVDLEDASRPAYMKVGDVVVAIVSMELTVGHIYQATEDSPGVHFTHPAFKGDDDELIEYLAEVVAEARKRAHLVFFTPHWDAWEDPPAVTRQMRSLAGKLIATAGFDAVLGHGRHEVQGVEVFEGKPVIYDAGNSLVDISGRGNPEGSRGLIWKVEFSAAGVHRLEGIPIKMRRNRTSIATGDELRAILDRSIERSAKYRAELREEQGRLHLELDPGGILAPTVAADAPKRERREGTVRYAPTDVLHERLPEGVIPVDVDFGNGIRLVGYESPSAAVVAKECSSLMVVLYWTTDRKQSESFLVHLEARQMTDGKVAKKALRREDHLPGDWMLPTIEWPVGKIIQDKTNVRLVSKKRPSGEVVFLVGLRKLKDGGRAGAVGGVLKPRAHSGVELFADTYAVVGPFPFDRKAPSPRNSYREWRHSRKIELSPVQPPFGAPPLNLDDIEE